MNSQTYTSISDFFKCPKLPSIKAWQVAHVIALKRLGSGTDSVGHLFLGMTFNFNYQQILHPFGKMDQKFKTMPHDQLRIYNKVLLQEECLLVPITKIFPVCSVKLIIPISSKVRNFLFLKCLIVANNSQVLWKAFENLSE